MIIYNRSLLVINQCMKNLQRQIEKDDQIQESINGFTYFLKCCRCCCFGAPVVVVFGPYFGLIYPSKSMENPPNVDSSFDSRSI
jgi:NADH:ubiquinone oxidoreductase subunit E